MSNPVKPSGRIDEFDGLRGILSLWVAVSHMLCWCGFVTVRFISDHGASKRLWDEFVFAAGAVETFMILSGFVITHLLYTDRQPFGKFMLGRFFRIYPVYLFCLLLGFGSIFFVPHILEQAQWRDTVYFQWEQSHSDCELARPIAHLVAHLTLLFGLVPEQILPQSAATLLTPAWSISLEWQFYLVAPLIALAVRSRTGILLLAAVCCGDFFYPRFWGNAFLPGKLSLFLVGIGFYHLYRNQDKWKSFNQIPYAILAVFCAVILVSWHWVALSIWVLVFGCLFIRAGDSGRFSVILLTLRRVLLHPVLQYLGRMSYPVYLIHWPVIILLMYGLLQIDPDITEGKALIFMCSLGLPIILAVAFLLHRFLEVPLMRLGKKYSGQSTKSGSYVR